jgi:hypothetical protein
MRSAIAGYVDIFSSSKNGKRVDIRRPLHPHLAYVPCSFPHSCSSAF